MRSVLVIAALLVGSICDAGMEQEFACSNCGLKGTYVQGALLTADQFVAFCPKDRFVHIAWDYHKRAPKPVRFDGGVSVYICPLQEADCTSLGREGVSKMWQQRHQSPPDRNGR